MAQDIRPYLKWAGGKRQLLGQIRKLMPKDIGSKYTYYEPFVGAGAVLFDIQPTRAVVGDANEQLIETYLAVRDRVDDLISLLEVHKSHHSKEYYYLVRDMDRNVASFAALSPVERAARFIYLNKTCYNGLYRVNSKGMFNVPFGKYKNPAIYDVDELRAISRFLDRNNIEIQNRDFEEVVSGADKSSFVYFDPPYHSPQKTNFADYQAWGFGEAEQRRLRDVFADLTERGVACLLSNSDTPLIRELYRGFEIKPVQANRFINSKASERGGVGEVLVTNRRRLNAKKKVFVVSTAKTSIESAWETLFEKYNILTNINANGVFRISSAQINEFKEARLMAKFDQSIQLPSIFRKNNLSILSVTRGEYVIGRFDTYFPLNYGDIAPKRVENPALTTIDIKNLYSEAAALLAAYNSGIIADILGCDASEVRYTMGGRMSSGKFEFGVRDSRDMGKTYPIEVDRAQVEIDAGFESPKAVCICEAKNIRAQELLIRQLYYPYRLWKGKTDKTVVPLFLTYSNDEFHAFIFEFTNESDYNSIRLKEHKAYTFADQAIALEDVRRLWAETEVGMEPSVTFPQANTFERVVDLLGALYQGPLAREEVTGRYGFDERQTNYYFSACKYLGLGKTGRNEAGEYAYELTDEARTLMGRSYRDKYLGLIGAVLSRPVFHGAFGIYLETGAIPEKAEIVEIMRRCRLPLNDVTLYRRASTVRGWLEWIAAQFGRTDRF